MASSPYLWVQHPQRPSLHPYSQLWKMEPFLFTPTRPCPLSLLARLGKGPRTPTDGGKIWTDANTMVFSSGSGGDWGRAGRCLLMLFLLGWCCLYAPLLLQSSYLHSNSNPIRKLHGLQPVLQTGRACSVSSGQAAWASLRCPAGSCLHSGYLNHSSKKLFPLRFYFICFFFKTCHRDSKKSTWKKCPPPSLHILPVMAKSFLLESLDQTGLH